MEGMRRTSDERKATDGIARLSVTARGVSLIRSSDPASAAAGGKGGKGGRALAAARGGGFTTASRVTDEEESDEELDERAVSAAQSRAADAAAKAGRKGASRAASTVRRGSSSTARTVKAGVLAGQRRVNAAVAAKASKVSAAEAAITVSKARAAAARAAAAGFLRGIAAAVTTLVSSAPVLAIITAIVVALIAVISIIGWLIPATEPSTKAENITGDIGATVGLDGWVSPVPAGTVLTSDYGPRPSICTPAGCTKPFHYGIDLPQGCGAEIRAAADGVVEVAGPYGDFGNAVVLDHVYKGMAMTTMYAHMQAGSLTVAKGETVKAGTVIGHEGDTGKSAGCHMHFEVTAGGLRINPRVFLASVGIAYP